MGDPCAACTHAYDNHACEKCIDFGDWSPCRQLGPIIDRIRAGEREKCLRIIETECAKAIADERCQMRIAASDGRETAELIFGHGVWAFDALGTAIYHAVNGASMEDPIAEERALCANICADIAGEVDWSARGIMQMDAEQVGIECAKRIRGEQ